MIKKNGKIIKNAIVIIVFIIVAWVSFNEYIITKIVPYSVNKLSNFNEEYEIDNSIIQIEKEYPKEEIIQKYKGFEVAAKLEIPAIELETYILKNFSESALNVSVTKFWGVNPNEIGNLCVAGHNFKNKNMFRNLKKLKVGDTLTISDNDVGKVEYIIYDIYRVSPDDISCLSQDTNNLKVVTLITCTSNSKERIIVKAREL